MSKSVDKKKELPKQNNLLSNIVEQSPIPTFIINKKGVIVIVNNAFVNTWGVEKKEFILGQNALTKASNVENGVVIYLEQALKGETIEAREIPYISQITGNTIITNSKIFPIFDSNNNVEYVAVMQIDLTNQKKAEKEKESYFKNFEFLAETTFNLFKLDTEDDLFKYLLRHLLNLVDASLLVASVVDENGFFPKYIDGNNEYVKESWSLFEKFPAKREHYERYPLIFQSKLFEIKGGIYEFSFGSVPKDICEKLEKQFSIGKLYKIGLNKGDRLFGSVSIALSKGKEIINIELIETFIKQVSLVLYFKQIEKELILAKEKAEASDNLKTAFIANISHDIRTPLHAISGFSKILSTKSLEKEKEIQYLKYISQNCNTLQGLLDDLISISQIESGQLQINRKDFNVESLLNDIYLNFLASTKFDEKGAVKLVLDIKSEVKNIKLCSDELRIKQVLNNLISNALKFTKEGFVKIGCRFKENAILFYVIDTGIGIREEKREIIFDRFQRLDYNLDENDYGTGLGLSISKSLIELLGGKIWVDSEVGKGSTFYFSIPFEKETQSKEISSRKLVVNNKKDWTGKTILVAEDDDFNYLIITEALEDFNPKLLRAKTGNEVVDICNNEGDIDLILMDIQMPEMNGYDACAKVLEKFPNMKIIAQTAYSFENERSRLLEVGCVDFIGKPIDINEMVDKLDKYLLK